MFTTFLTLHFLHVYMIIKGIFKRYFINDSEVGAIGMYYFEVPKGNKNIPGLVKLVNPLLTPLLLP
jgi:hypothetical protein